MNISDYVDILNGEKTTITGCFGTLLSDGYKWDEVKTYQISSSKKCFMKYEDIKDHNFEIIIVVDGITICTGYRKNNLFIIDENTAFEIME